MAKNATDDPLSFLYCAHIKICPLAHGFSCFVGWLVGFSFAQPGKLSDLASVPEMIL